MPSWYWLVWGVLSLAFAVAGAFWHNLFVVVWNTLWLGLYIYLYTEARDAGR